MSSKGILAVSLFVGSILIVNSRSLAPTSFDWSHDPVVAGASVSVKVTTAPCHPVTVTISIGSYSKSVTINEIPGEASLGVPAGTEGQGYTISVSCPNERDSQSGAVL